MYLQDHNALKIRLMCDNLIKATSDEADFSTSLANLREYFNQENVRSTPQRLGMICQLPLIFFTTINTKLLCGIPCFHTLRINDCVG